MEFSVKSGTPEKQRSSCLVAGVFEGRKLSQPAQTLDKASDGYLCSLLRRGDLEGKLGQYLLLHDVPHVLADRVLLIGCGKERTLNDQQYRQIIQKSTKILAETGAMEATSYLTDLPLKQRQSDWKVKQAVEATLDALYQFTALKSKKDPVKRVLKRIIWNISSRRDLNACELAVTQGRAVGNNVEWAKNLANLPANICTPDYLAEQAEALAAQYSSISVSVLGQKQMEEMGMGAFLAVAQGSSRAAKLIVAHYHGGANNQEPIALVGKGITFDSGGLSLKPAANMMSMKYDMCGAASVLATLKVAAELKLPLNVISLMACAENMPSGNASRPDDVVKSLSGLTIEIANTDAEGRLVLCDTLTYCERFNPCVVIDVATLTGSCVVALGQHASGLLSNHSPLANDLLVAGEYSGDRAWQMPLWDDYQSQLDSPVADICNVGGPEAGVITAACFLSRFTKKYNWAHLDVAGSAFRTGKDARATGRPVPLLSQYLINVCNKQKS